MTRTKIAVLGATGRMGQAVIPLCVSDSAATLVAACCSPTNSCIGEILQEEPDVRLSADIVSAAACADVIIDFCTPGHMQENLQAAQKAGCAYLVGTTGLSNKDQQALDRAANDIAVLQAGNFSLGVNLLMNLVSLATEKLGADYDVDIVDVHHRGKLDAPSGTALALMDSVKSGAVNNMRSGDIQADNTQPLLGDKDSQIPIHSLRGGGVIGDHDVIFSGPEERLILSHRADDRALFARGALKAAKWLARQPAGRYTMADMLGLG